MANECASQTTRKRTTRRSAKPHGHAFIATLFLLSAVPFTISSLNDVSPLVEPREGNSPQVGAFEAKYARSPPTVKSKSKRDSGIPLKVTNNCAETIWPAIASQAGTGPSSGGFELKPGESNEMSVSEDWQGRVWGRTNCSFNAAGTGASNLNGNNGAGAACGTGDCNSVISCVVTGDVPVTLAEFDLKGGVGNGQTFYDISLVDGYNLPLGLVYIPGDDPKLQSIPPNLVNAACIATTGLLLPPSSSGTEGGSTNASFPLPYESKTTSAELATWCPWDLQVELPKKPGDGVYPYPDDTIQRPAFDPCLSACAKTNAPSDCCTGSYNAPQNCKRNMYANAAKAVCPDAYSYAFDDQTSTFIIPSGGGWEVVFCPTGRSTNILATFGSLLSDLASSGSVSESMIQQAQNVTLVAKGDGESLRRSAKGMQSLGALVVVLAWVVLW